MLVQALESHNSERLFITVVKLANFIVKGEEEDVPVMIVSLSPLRSIERIDSINNNIRTTALVVTITINTITIRVQLTTLTHPRLCHYNDEVS